MALFAVILVLGFAGSGLGDQLQWNPLSVCRDAAKVIARHPLLVSFCSQADEDHIGLWLVRDLEAAATPVQDLHEILVSAELLYRSDRAYSSGEFPLPEEQQAFHKARNGSSFAVSIDLAYVYIYVGGGSFQCLAKVLGLDCVVGVETIHLPRYVMEDIVASSEAKCHTILWPPSEASERCLFRCHHVPVRSAYRHNMDTDHGHAVGTYRARGRYARACLDPCRASIAHRPAVPSPWGLPRPNRSDRSFQQSCRPTKRIGSSSLRKSNPPRCRGGSRLPYPTCPRDSSSWPCRRSVRSTPVPWSHQSIRTGQSQPHATRRRSRTQPTYSLWSVHYEVETFFATIRNQLLPCTWRQAISFFAHNVTRGLAKSHTSTPSRCAARGETPTTFGSSCLHSNPTCSSTYGRFSTTSARTFRFTSLRRTSVRVLVWKWLNSSCSQRFSLGSRMYRARSTHGDRVDQATTVTSASTSTPQWDQAGSSSWWMRLCRLVPEASQQQQGAIGDQWNRKRAALRRGPRRPRFVAGDCDESLSCDTPHHETANERVLHFSPRLQTEVPELDLRVIAEAA